MAMVRTDEVTRICACGCGRKIPQSRVAINCRYIGGHKRKVETETSCATIAARPRKSNKKGGRSVNTRSHSFEGIMIMAKENLAAVMQEIIEQEKIGADLQILVSKLYKSKQQYESLIESLKPMTGESNA
jgi:hypothetical protein